MPTEPLSELRRDEDLAVIWPEHPIMGRTIVGPPPRGSRASIVFNPLQLITVQNYLDGGAEA